MERVSSPPEGPSRQPVFERASAPWAQPRERSFPDPSSEEHGMAQHGASELHSRLQQLFAAEGVSVGAGGRPGYPGGAPRFEPPQHDVYSFEVHIFMLHLVSVIAGLEDEDYATRERSFCLVKLIFGGSLWESMRNCL